MTKTNMLPLWPAARPFCSALHRKPRGDLSLYCHTTRLLFISASCMLLPPLLCVYYDFSFFFVPPSSLRRSGSWRRAKLNKGLAARPLLNNLGWSGLFLWHSGSGSAEPAGTVHRPHSVHSVCTCLSFMGESLWEPCKSELRTWFQ